MKPTITSFLWPLPGARSWKLMPLLLAAVLSCWATTAGAQQWTIGTGTTTNSSYDYPTPYGAYFSGQRAQYLYRAAELTAAGMTAGTIHQIAFNISSTNGAGNHGQFSIQIDSTNRANLTAWKTMGPLTSGLYSSPGIVPTLTGWNTYTLSTPFSWDGVSNIVVEVCHWNGPSTWTYNASVYHSSTTNTTIGYYSDSGGPFCGNNGLTVNTYSLRPNARFTRLLPCFGKPTPGTTAPSGTVAACPGTSYTIVNSGGSVNANLSYQWMQSTNGGTTWVPVVGGSGATTQSYITPGITFPIRYHLVVTCNNSGDQDSTANVIFNVTSPTYAALPFTESFENWINGCSTSDIPSASWTNIPATGDNSMRREDQGSTAAWTSSTTGGYTPVFKTGAHSARWHGYYGPTRPTTGNLSAYVNCLTPTVANKELRFYYINANNSASYPKDSLYVDMSINGGVTFFNIAKYGSGTGGWDQKIVPIASNSAQTVIAFRPSQSYAYYGDIGIDGVQVLPPCSGKPVAGKIDTVKVCSGQPFNLTLTGTSASAGLAYLWQYRPHGNGPWASLPGGTVYSPSATITAPTDFRVIVTCTNGSPTLDDTSAVYEATLQPFYFCYCNNPAQYVATFSYSNAGNVTLRTIPGQAILLNNGNPIPYINNPAANLVYSDFRTTVAPPTLIRDSTYRISVTNSTSNSYYYGSLDYVWIDTDRNGVFDGDELMVAASVSSTAAIPVGSGTFAILHKTPVGLTGMRVVSNYYYTPSPCGGTYYGETEDYLVRIEYNPCSGPSEPGIAYISDTAVCPGYTVDMWDTSYEKQRTGILRDWEMSINGGASYTTIPGSSQKDTLANVTVTTASVTKYRLRVRCTITGDTTYSNVLTVTLPAPVRCYPYASASFGSQDSSDIGAFVIGDFVNPVAGVTAGPHLNNPQARRRRTDYTLLQGINLEADSTYRLAVFQTMLRSVHSNALVSVYIDYNNDGKYDLVAPTNPPGNPFTSELVFQGMTHADSFYLDTRVKMPSAVIPDVLTGLRVIINNDLNPLGEGNKGAGAFVSGEVEDYVAMFRRVALGVGGAGSGVLSEVSLYPNPTEGKFTVLSNSGRNVGRVEVEVRTITGQQVLSRVYEGVGQHFSADLDLSGKAKGIYFVELRAEGGQKVTRKLVVR